MVHCFALGTCTKRKHELLVKVNQVTALADLNSECHWQNNIRRLQGFHWAAESLSTSDVLAIAIWLCSFQIPYFMFKCMNLSHGKTTVKHL